MDGRNQIADNLRRKLYETGMSQKMLSDAVGVTEVTISRYVHGIRTPRAPILEKMATALRTSPEDLLGMPDLEDSEAAFYRVIYKIKTHAGEWDNKHKKAVIWALMGWED